MRIIGLDLSLVRTGICELDGTDYEPTSFGTVPDRPLDERISLITHIIMTKVNADCRVFIEGHAFSRVASQGMRDRTELAGVIKQSLFLSKVLYAVVSPTTLKKWVTGHGGSKGNKVEKPLMLHLVAKKIGVECRNDDEADAVALADFGWHVLNPESPRRELLQYEKNTIAAFVSPKVKKPRKRKAE